MIIDRLWRQQQAAYFFLATKSASGRFEEHAFKRNEIRDIAEFCQENQDKDVYFCPHGFKKDTRRKEHAVLPQLLWADLDGVNPKSCNPKPTIAFESSPGRYVGLWMTDKPVTEELNRRLTYHLGADHGGWDLTQVLRMPGTFNYKYAGQPRVKILWDDGPSWTLKQLNAILPEAEEASDLSAQEIYNKYEKGMQPWVRRELLRTERSPEGKRSEMIWKLEHALLEQGLSKEEVLVLIKASVWNKFKGRASEDEQLRRELDKIVSERMKAGMSRPGITKKKFLKTPMSEVEELDTHWLWKPVLARGEVTIMQGDPGLRKSYIAQMISKALCDGERLPRWVNDRNGVVQGKVAYFDIENSPERVTKKRLASNGMERQDQFFQEDEPFSWTDGERMAEVMDAIEELKPTLVVFDTMNTYMGGHVDTTQANVVQSAMMPLREIAVRFNCAVLVIRHLVKSKKDRSAMDAGMGSQGIAGFVRIMATVGKMPEDPNTFVMAMTKCNLSSQPSKVLTFTVKELPDEDGHRDRSKFIWGEFVEGLTSDDIIRPGKSDDKKNVAEEFLKDVLDEGEEDVKKLEVMAEKKGIGRRTLHRAAEVLNVTKRLVGFGKGKTSYWSIE